MTNVTIETMDAKHDINGNPIAHCMVWIGDVFAFDSGKRRRQIGYDGKCNMWALVELRERYGIEIDTTGKRFDKDGGKVSYKIIKGGQ